MCKLFVNEPLAQAGNVIGQGADLAVIELGGHLAHLQAVFAGAITERGQLGRRVFGMLATQTRVLGRNSGTVRL